MHPVHHNHPSHHHQHSVQPSSAPHAVPSPGVEEFLRNIYVGSDQRVRDAIQHSPSLNHEARQMCLKFVEHLCIYKYLAAGADIANVWTRWASLQQLSHHSVIRVRLLKFLKDDPCSQHNGLLTRDTSDDESDLLYHLVRFDRNPGLYELANKPASGPVNESAEVIELLWRFLIKPQRADVKRRLLCCIFRMSRKSAYLPRAMYIQNPSISNRVDIPSGGEATMTKAKMNDREVAIKRVLCKDRDTQRKYVEMFASEAILWRTLQHDNIVPFLGFILEGNGFNIALVSPFYRNGNLKNYMRRYEPRDWPTLARKLARDVAKGLAYVHGHQPPIFHGDLKADNVLIDDRGYARLGDFGRSYAADSAAFLDSTRVGLAVNPVYWMAPELMNNDRAKASDKSDIYSFGCVLYEMVSGKLPFDGYPIGEILWRVMKGDRPDWPQSGGAHDPLWQVANDCWKSDPKARPSARRLVSLLTDRAPPNGAVLVT